MNKFGLLYSDEYLKYSLGAFHPMNPNRIASAISLFDYVLRDTDEIQLIAPATVDPSVLEMAHSTEYINTLKLLSNPNASLPSGIHNEAFLKYGIGSGDCPVFDHMAEISELVVGSTLKAAEAIMSGSFSKAFVMLAGLHHASREKASGFCYYNDINVTIHRLKKLYSDPKILYIDTDLHAGDGVAYEFYNDPNVLSVSFHESGKYLFPGTCFSNEIGSKEGKGYTINFPLLPNTYDELYLELFEKYLLSIVESFNPDLIIWQAGVDGHADDPLGHLQLTTKTYQELGKIINRIGNKMNDQKILSLGGGGYNPISVSKSWLSEISSLAGIKQLTKSPESWRENCQRSFGIEMPKNLVDRGSPLTNEQIERINFHSQPLIEEFENNISPFWSIS